MSVGKMLRLLLGEVEEKLNRILDREIYEHVKRKAKEKFGLNLDGVAFKLLIQYTIELLRENPNMSLNEYLRKLGVIGRAKNGKLRRLLSVATLPIYINKK